MAPTWKKLVFDSDVIRAHSDLSELDYASAGHTGFAGTGVANTFSEEQTFGGDMTLTGELKVEPDTDSLTAFVVNDTDANRVLTVDTINNRIGVGVTDPDTQLEILNAGNQLKLSYDGTDNAVFAVDTDGNLTVTTSGPTLAIPKALRLGTGTTLESGFSSEGDIYSEDGSLYVGAGAQSVAERYGVGLQVRESALTKTLVYAAVDAAFTAATGTITIAGQTFVTDGVVVNDFLVVIGASDTAYIGSVGEIDAVTETTIQVSIAAAGAAVPDDLTSFNFIVYNQPVAAILDNGDIHFAVGVSQDASFKVLSAAGANDHSAHLDVTAAVDGHHGLGIDFDPDTYGGTAAERINFDAAASVDGIDGTGVDLVINNAGADGGHIHGLDVEIVDPTNTDLEVAGLATHSGVDVIHQHLGDPASIVAAYKYSGGSYTDLTFALSASGGDSELFSNDNDYLYLASATVWDEINVILSTNADKSIHPDFEYVTSAGAWVAFGPSDGTNGFQQNGTIRFDSADLTTWGVRTVNQVTGEVGAVNYYWIRIQRTRNNVPVPPYESSIRVTAILTEYGWDKDGDLAINNIDADGDVTVTGDVYQGAGLIGLFGRDVKANLAPQSWANGTDMGSDPGGDDFFTKNTTVWTSKSTPRIWQVTDYDSWLTLGGQYSGASSTHAIIQASLDGNTGSVYARWTTGGVNTDHYTGIVIMQPDLKKGMAVWLWWDQSEATLKATLAEYSSATAWDSQAGFADSSACWTTDWTAIQTISIPLVAAGAPMFRLQPNVSGYTRWYIFDALGIGSYAVTGNSGAGFTPAYAYLMCDGSQNLYKYAYWDYVYTTA